jgi:hypothetical protein
MAGRLLRVVELIVPSIFVATYPLPDLSAHCVIPVVAFDVIVAVSAASSHRTHPGIVGAPSPELKVETICAPVGKKTEGWLVSVFEMIGDPDVVINVFPTDDLSEIDLTIDVVPDKLIVDVAWASSHNDNPERRGGKNRSWFNTLAIAILVDLCYVSPSKFTQFTSHS